MSAVGVRRVLLPVPHVLQTPLTRFQEPPPAASWSSATPADEGYQGAHVRPGRVERAASDGNKWASAVPVRFVSACERGHVTDFPWIPFAHMDRPDGKCERPELYLDEKAVGDIGRIYVKCANCHSQNPMSKAPVMPFTCTGDRPWLGGGAMNEPCILHQLLLVRTASHAYFAQVVSALRLHEPKPDALRLRLQAKDVWKALSKVTTADELALLAKLMDHVASAIQGYSPEAVLAAIRAENAGSEATAERPLRSAEYERLVLAPPELPGSVVDAGEAFAVFRVPKNKVDLPTGVGGLVVVPELRQVREQVSFSRFDSFGANLKGAHDFDRRQVKPAVLTSPTGQRKMAARRRGAGRRRHCRTGPRRRADVGREAGGGAAGVRDRGLLESAIAQPQSCFGGQLAHEGLFEMAAASLFHIVQNHRFVDGNKRTGLLAALVFLDVNGIGVDHASESLYELTMGVTEGRIAKRQIAAELMRISTETR